MVRVITLNVIPVIQILMFFAVPYEPNGNTIFVSVIIIWLSIFKVFDQRSKVLGEALMTPDPGLIFALMVKSIKSSPRKCDVICMHSISYMYLLPLREDIRQSRSLGLAVLGSLLPADSFFAYTQLSNGDPNGDHETKYDSLHVNRCNCACFRYRGVL